MAPDSIERIAVLETQYGSIARDLAAIKTDLRALLEHESERRGARNVARALWGIGIAALSAIVSIGVQVLTAGRH